MQVNPQSKNKSNKKNRNWRHLVREFGIFGLFILLCAFLSFLSPHFLTVSNLINILRQSSIYAILAFGMTFVMLSGRIDLSVGSVLSLSSCIAGLSLLAGFNIWLSALFAVLVGGFCGLINGFLIAKLRVPFFIATVGMMYAARGFALFITKGNPVSGLPSEFQLFGASYVGPIPMQVIIALFVFVVCYLILNHTRLGRYTYAIGSNEVATKMSGVNVEKYIMLIFTVSGLTAGIGGVIMASRLRIGSPIVAAGYDLDAIAAVAIGGTSLLGGEGNIIGTIIGALMLTVIRVGLNILGVSTFIQQIIIGCVIVGVVALDMWEKKDKH